MKKQHVAIVGPIGAGKTTAAEFFQNKGFESYKLSYAITLEAEKRGLDRGNRKILQDLGDEMRERDGLEVLASIAVQHLKKSPKQHFVVESIRNHHELKYLKDYFGKKLLILAINAPLKVRYERAVSRQGQYKEQEMSFTEFKEIDKRDFGINNKPNEQNVDKCIKMADFMILNNASESHLTRELDKVYGEYFE